jgi:hypothetical protein
MLEIAHAQQVPRFNRMPDPVSFVPNVGVD